MRIPITQAQERTAFSIIDGARFSLEQVQCLSSIDENRPLGIETDEVQKFLFYWDQIFLFGLKSAKRGYWNFVSTFSHPSLVQEVRNTPGAVNDLLRSRLWLGTILNENELENYLTLVQFENKLLEKYYRPHAILRNRSQLEDLISISCGQENTLFAIHLDYICFREKQLFVGPGDRTSFDKLFDIKFNWDESIRSRSASSVSVSSNFFSRTPSYSRSSRNSPSYSGTPVGVLALEEDEEERVGVEPQRPGSGQLRSTSEIVEFSSTDQLAGAVSPAVPSSIPDVHTSSKEGGEVDSGCKLEEVVITSNSPDNCEVSVIPETELLAVAPSLKSVKSPTKPSSPPTKPSSPPTSLLHKPQMNEPNSVLSRPTSPISRPITPASRQIISSSPKAATPASVLAVEEMRPIRITTSDHGSVGSVSPPQVDYQIALCPGDQLALSPGNQQALDMFIGQHSQTASPLASQPASPLARQSASQHASPLPSRPTSEPEDNQSLESYNEPEEEGQQQDKVQEEMIMGQIADIVVEDVLMERDEKTQVTEDLYSNTDSEDLSIQAPEGEDEEDQIVQTPGSDPYLLDSGSGSPTLLVPNIPEPPSSSSWYDKETPLNQQDVKCPPVHLEKEKQEDLLSASLEEYELPEEDISGKEPEKNTYFNREEREEDLVSSLKEASQTSSKVEKTEELNPFGDGSEEDEDDVKMGQSGAVRSEVRGYSQSFSRKEEPIVVPDFSFGTMDRDLGVVIPTQNQKITWAVELFGDNEDLCFMYRIWLKDVAGNLELSYFLLTTQTIYLLDSLFLVKHRLSLERVQYGRGMNWQVITLFVLLDDGTTDQIDIITGCEAISRGIMEGISVNPSYPVNWAMQESYSQMRLKYHVNTFLQEKGAFSLSSADDLYYASVSYLSLTAPPSSALHCPISEGKMWLKEPTLLSYVWNRYYFILDKQGKLSQLDEECAGVIKKEYTVIGSVGCRKMTRKETSKQFAFKFISEEGTEVMLNCDDYLERDRWMTAISKAAMEIPQSNNETGFGMQCSAVVNNSYFVVVREGVKSAYTVDSALIQDITEIRWDSDNEMCVVTIDKRQWLLLFRDQYEKIKLMECLWERWQDIFKCHDLQLLFTKVDFRELEKPLKILDTYRKYLSATAMDNSEFECL
ncbi:hypothetical protein ACHWQZ_G016340 [Mnemiopsis leidyi]